MKFLPLIWANLSRKPWRSILTFIGVIFGFALFALLHSVDLAFETNIRAAQLDRLFSFSRVSLFETLPLAYKGQIERVPGVQSVAYSAVISPAYYQDPRNPILGGAVEPRGFFDFYRELKLPADQLETLVHTRTGAVVGLALATKYGWKIGDRVPLHSAVSPKRDGSSDWAFDIVGIFDDPDDHSRANRFIVNYDYFDEERTRGKGAVTFFYERVDDPKESIRIASDIDTLFRNSSHETRTQTDREFSRALLKQIGDVGFITQSIGVATFFAILFLVGNTIMQSVKERAAEFAVLRTLGFSIRVIGALVVIEVTLICAPAALIGAFSASTVGLTTSAILPQLAQVASAIHVTPATAGEALILATLLAGVCALPSVMVVSRMNIASVLTKG